MGYYVPLSTHSFCKMHFARKISRKRIVDFIFGALILSPQVSFRIYGVVVDTSIVLLFVMIVRFLFNIYVNKWKVSCPQFHFIILLFLFIVLLFIQSYCNDGSLIRAHLVMGEGRDVGTFGAYIMTKTSFFNYINIRLLLVFIFAFLIGDEFGRLSIYDIKARLFMIIYVGCFIQMFLIVLDYTGNLNQFVLNFMVQNVAEGDIHSAFRTYRFGLNRYSAGFSEPSFFITVIWIVLSAIYILRIQFKDLFSKREMYMLGASAVFFFLTTISVFMLACIGLCLAIFTSLSVRKYLLVVFGCLLFVHFIIDIFNSSLFSNIELSSVVIRLFMRAELSQLSIHTLVLGSQLGYVYSNPPLVGIILQLGILFFVLFFVVITKGIPYKLYILFSSFCVLLISPNIGAPYFFMHCFLLTSICYRIGVSKLQS